MIHIVHIIHLDGPGGGPRTASSHVSYYCSCFKITVITGGRGHLTRMCGKLGVPVIRLPIDQLDLCWVGFPLLVLNLLRLRPDLLILHGQWAGPMGALAGKLAGIRRMIYICHWPAFYTDWDLFRVVRNYISEKIVCSLASRTIAISESNQYQYLLRGLVPEGRLAMLPNPVPLDQVPSAAEAQKIRQELFAEPGACHVVSVGRLCDQKRVDWLLDAWAIVKRDAPQARLWIIGDGPLEGELRARAARLGLGDTCRFLGSRSDAWTCIAAGDITVMTSIYEARGNVITESMACGKPVVSNAVDGIKDSMVDGVCGFLVPPEDPGAMAQALLRLIHDPQLRKVMGERGLTKVQEFEKISVLKKYLHIIQNVLKE